MKNLTKLLALLLALVMVFSVMAGCSNSAAPAEEDPTPAATDEPTEPADEPEEPTDEPEEPADTTAVYATATFGEKFSPFFATTAYDQEVADLTGGTLLTADRGGNIIRNGIEGETVEYNGTEYTYYGMGNVEVVMNDDGTVDYNLTMRDDIVFSDGTPANIDDVIFGIYVLADPTYDGSSTLYAQPIEGIQEYYNSMAYKSDLIVEAGRDGTSDYFTAEESAKYWAAFDAAGEKFAQEIIDYCVAAYIDYAPDYIGATAEEVQADTALQVKLGMFLWGFDGAWFEGATAADYWAAIADAYGNVVADIEGESAGSSIAELIDEELGADAPVLHEVIATDSVDHIAGIIRTGDYSMTVHMTEYDATSIYNMAFTIAPLHYYGDESLYDYDNNSFGFPKGDLSLVRAKTTQPLGCGPYVFDNYSNGVVTLKANPYYFEGEPAVKTLLMQEANDADYVPGIITGTFDIAVPSISEDTLNAITDANSNGELTGDVVTTYLVDYRGYGYLGINANLVNVGGEPGSDASKDLRKGFMTVLSVYRDSVINSYYGDRAAVIQYPISNTSWAAPRPTDEGYQNCYSNTVDGEPIYTDAMNDEQKYEAALEAAVGFFKAAGYTWDEASGTFTAAPDGASLTYEILIPGQGQQDHPAYGIAVAASEQLAKIGITLQVNDVGTSTWNNALEANSAQMWVAAWQSTADPDMYQVYHSRNANGQNTNSNHYQIQDSALDDLIIAGRTSADNDFRKATYKSAMEIILDWGCELPLYQRKDCTTTSTERINNDTMPKDMTPYWGWYAEINTLAVQ